MTDQIENLPKKQITFDQAQIYNRTINIGMIAAVVTIAMVSLLYFTEFQAEAPFQLISYAIALTAALGILILSRSIFIRGNIIFAEAILPAAIYASFALPNLFVSGLEILLIVTGLIVFAISAYTLKVKVPSWWVITGAIFALFNTLLVFIPPAGRFDIAQSIFWNTILTTILSGLILAILWQLIQSIQNVSINTRLLTSLITIALIPALVSVISSSNLTIQNGRNEILEKLTLNSNHNVANINEWINDLQRDLQLPPSVVTNLNDYINGDLETVSENQLARQIRAELNSISLQQNGELPNRFDNIYIVDLNGDVLIATEITLERENHNTEEYFLEGINRNTYASPIVSNSSGGIDFLVSTPLFDQNNNLIAIIAGDPNTDSLNNLLTIDSIPGDSGETYIVDRSSTLITQTNTPIISPLVNTQATANAIVDHTNGQGLYENYASVLVLGVYEWIPDLQIALITEVSTNDALLPYINTLIITISISLFAIAIAIGASVLITRSISNPIIDLSTNAAGFANQTLSNIPTLNRSDELGRLSETLHEISLNINEAQSNIDGIVNERTKMIDTKSKIYQSAAEIFKATANSDNLEDILTTASHLINEKLGYYHVGLYLLDANREFAELKATNSEGGWRMLTRGHKLPVGGDTIIGFVTQSGRPRIKQNIGGSGVYYDNPDLPLTRSQLTLPIMLKDEPIGALDIQSTEETAFNEDDIQTLEVLTQTISTTIENIKRLEEMQNTLQSERLVYGILNQESWTGVLSQEAIGYISDASGTRLNSGEVSDPATKDAINHGKTVLLENDNESYKIAVPVKIRGNVTIAAIETEKSLDQGPWNTTEIEILEAIAEQLGIALENARLFEQTQNLARKERIAADVSGKVWSSSDINTILQTAVQELGRALNASEGSIRLRLPDNKEG